MNHDTPVLAEFPPSGFAPDMLAGRIAVVTGGSRGIGYAVAEALIACSAQVIIADIDGDAAAVAVDTLGPRACAVSIDVADFESCVAAARDIAARFPPVSFLVNNAGISGERPIDDPESGALWARQIAVNQTGVFNVTRAFVPALRQTKGCVVNLCSTASFGAVTGAYGYVASKHAVKGLTAALARELAVDGIRVNGVAPAVIATEMTARRRADPELIGPALARTPLRRVGTPREVAWPIVFLLSDLASYITGTVLPIDGGYLAV